MKKIPKIGIAIAAFFIIVVAINWVFQVPQGEGFNPSDDGVILAQSYRILNGEIPHADFISIRPVGSAYFHLISFALPFPLEPTARWITLLEYLIFSLMWSYLLFKKLPLRFRNIPFFVLLSTLVFVLNQNYYNLFPWTTIDALFFFSIGFFVYWNWRKNQRDKLKEVLWFFLISFFIGYSALCRQTFILPALVLAGILLIDSVKQKRLFTFVAGAILGLWPYYVYTWNLVIRSSFRTFYDQLSGRTELWETGFLKFGNEFWNSPLLILFIGLLVFFLAYRLTQSQNSISIALLGFRKISALILLLVLIGLVLYIFISPTHLFSTAFALFFLCLILLICAPLLGNQGDTQDGLSWWIIGLAWTSAISLGDNSPVFSSGMLAGASLILVILQILNAYKLGNFRYSGYAWIFIVLSVGLIGSGIYAQKMNNYRDLSSTDLNFRMDSFFEDMGGIKTNSKTYSYLLDIHRIYTELDSPKDRFVVLPNNSLIYPMLQSKNPLPLDWMQGPEFVGQEDELLLALKGLDRGTGLVLLFDKFNSKMLADSLVEMRYPASVYPYYQYLLDNSEAIPEISSIWFDVRIYQ